MEVITLGIISLCFGALLPSIPMAFADRKQASMYKQMDIHWENIQTNEWEDGDESIQTN